MIEQLDVLTRQVLAIVGGAEVGRRPMSVPGVGPITALALRATLDQPDRFRRPRDVGAHLCLTPARDQSGETDTVARSAVAAANRPAPRSTRPPIPS